MKLTADDFAATMQVALDSYSALRPRSMQAELGPSDIGHCRSKALWKISGIEATDAPTSRQALNGTALHTMYTEARKAFNPRLLLEQELTITLPSGIVVLGHADEIDPDEPSVTDYKTVGDEADLAAQRRTGSTEGQRFQRHLYALGAIQAGLVPEEGLIVRNWWADRAGYDKVGLVEQEPFDRDVVAAADAWLSDVLYAKEHGEELPREKPFGWCRDFCEFFAMCRTGTQHPDVEITDPEMVQAARLLLDGRSEKQTGTRLETAAKRTLKVLENSGDDISAFVLGDVRLRILWVNDESKKNGGYFKYISEAAA